jgi:hypothetical protein
MPLPTVARSILAAYGGGMATVSRAPRPLRIVVLALLWASMTGLLCLLLTSTSAPHDGSTSNETSVATQASTPVLLPARHQVDLAVILPVPVSIAFGICVALVAPVVLPAPALRRPSNRHTPRAPPAAFAT